MSLFVDGYHMCERCKNGTTPLDLATDDTCREMLEHHAAILATIDDDPATLVSSIQTLCANLSASDEPLPAMALYLRAFQLDPSFHWAPLAARAAVFTWARDAFIVQLATTTRPFTILPDDCAGDVLEFIEMGMTRSEKLHITTHCSSPEACAWVRAVIAAAAVTAISVSAVICFLKLAE